MSKDSAITIAYIAMAIVVDLMLWAMIIWGLIKLIG